MFMVHYVQNFMQIAQVMIRNPSDNYKMLNKFSYFHPNNAIYVATSNISEREISIIYVKSPSVSKLAAQSSPWRIPCYRSVHFTLQWFGLIRTQWCVFWLEDRAKLRLVLWAGPDNMYVTPAMIAPKPASISIQNHKRTESSSIPPPTSKPTQGPTFHITRYISRN